MKAHLTAGMTRLDLVVTRHPLSNTPLGTSDRPGTHAPDERFTPVQYERAVIQRLLFTMEMVGHKQAPAQGRYK